MPLIHRYAAAVPTLWAYHGLKGILRPRKPLDKTFLHMEYSLMNKLNVDYNGITLFTNHHVPVTTVNVPKHDQIFVIAILYHTQTQ